MEKKGAIVLGTDADNSHSATGTLVMTCGYPSDATENAVKAGIPAADYR